jgi:hypothetical protein
MELVFAGATWVILIVWILSLVHWMIQGDVDAISGVAGIGLGFGLGYTALKPPIPILSEISFFLALMTVCLYPVASGVFNRHQLKELDVENVAKAYRLIGQRPDSPLAKAKLAESIYRLGMVGHAVAIAQDALAYIPERTALEEHRLLRRWKSAGIPPDTLKPITCVECHTPCPPGWTHCRHCGAQFLLDRAKGHMFPTGISRKILAIWMSAVAICLGVPISLALPIFAEVGVLCAIVLLVGGVWLLALQPPKERIV